MAKSTMSEVVKDFLPVARMWYEEALVIYNARPSPERYKKLEELRRALDKVETTAAKFR